MTTIPATTWIPASGIGEGQSVTADTITDSTNNTVVDASANDLVSASVTSSVVPKTTWTTNDIA